MSLYLNQIQPGEDTLARENVEYFLAHPERLFKEKARIRIMICEGQPFRYYCIDGNTRLFVAYKLGVTTIPRAPHQPKREELFLPVALDCFHRKRIRTWADLEKVIIPAAIRETLPEDY